MEPAEASRRNLAGHNGATISLGMPECDGLGTELQFEPSLVAPDVRHRQSTTPSCNRSQARGRAS